MKPAIHTQLWTDGVRQALAFGRYPALLVSLHAKTIYTTFFNFEKAPPEDARLVRSFLDKQEEFQRSTIEALAADPLLSSDVTPEAIGRNRRLVAATDRMSLEICWGVTDEASIPNVPTTGTDVTELHIRSPQGDPADLTLSPWPFATDHVEGCSAKAATCAVVSLRRRHFATLSAPPNARRFALCSGRRDRSGLILLTRIL